MAEVEVPHANGGAPEAPALAEEVPHGNGAAPEVAEEPQEPAPVSKGLYFVRVPRPTFDDSAIKKLDAELSVCFTKLKAINGKAQVKRVRGSSSSSPARAVPP